LPAEGGFGLKKMMLSASGTVIARAEKNWKVGRRGREGPARGTVETKKEVLRIESPI